jgi:hypothetical protein
VSAFLPNPRARWLPDNRLSLWKSELSSRKGAVGYADWAYVRKQVPAAQLRIDTLAWDHDGQQRSELYQIFPPDALADAKAYAKQLIETGVAKTVAVRGRWDPPWGRDKQVIDFGEMQLVQPSGLTDHEERSLLAAAEPGGWKGGFGYESELRSLERSGLVSQEGDRWQVTPAGQDQATKIMTHRRLIPNRSSVASARDIRRRFHDKEPSRETPVQWQWPRELQEIGTCEAIMYASNKWQATPTKIIDYKHVAEGPQRILVRPGFVQDHRTGRALSVTGPTHELNDMPDAFAVLDKILGVQVRLYEGSDDEPRLPDGDDGYYQIDIPHAYLGAAEHPVTGETFLFVYTEDGVHAMIVGDELAVEKDGITG